MKNSNKTIEQLICRDDFTNAVEERYYEGRFGKMKWGGECFKLAEIEGGVEITRKSTGEVITAILTTSSEVMDAEEYISVMVHSHYQPVAELKNDVYVPKTVRGEYTEQVGDYSIMIEATCLNSGHYKDYTAEKLNEHCRLTVRSILQNDVDEIVLHDLDIKICNKDNEVVYNRASNSHFPSYSYYDDAEILEGIKAILLPNLESIVNDEMVEYHNKFYHKNSILARIVKLY